MGNGVPNEQPHIIFEPTTGALIYRMEFATHTDLTREQHNAVRAAGVNAGGMSDVSAAYAAIRAALDEAVEGRDVWLDRFTTGADSTETGLLRRGVVWGFVSRGDIPAAPQP